MDTSDNSFPHSIVRSERDMGHAILRARRHLGLTQTDVGSRVRVKQPTVSSVENGNPGTSLHTLMLVLSALDLEIVVRKRGRGRMEDWGDDL